MLVRVDAPVNVLRDRLGRRALLKSAVSEADLEVLEHQLANEEPPTPDESAILVDNREDVDIEALTSLIRDIAAR